MPVADGVDVLTDGHITTTSAAPRTAQILDASGRSLQVLQMPATPVSVLSP